MVMEILPTKQEQVPPVGALEKYSVFTALIVTTVISSLLLAGDVQHWTLSKDVYDFVVGNRASTQLIVQVCANALGLLYITIICALINYATRIRLASVAISLDTLRFWTNLLSQHLEWTIPVHFLIPLLVFIGLCVIPSAIWAAAITPISVTAFRQQTIQLPSYSDITLLSYDWSNRDNGPSVRNSKGFFTYNVAEEFLGTLLASASLATTIDGSVRQHSKNDFSRFTYNNRSYGIGASVGLVDDKIIHDPLVTQYTFREAGYAPMVTCIYNASSAYYINATEQDNSTFIFAAQGSLPNSDWTTGQGEWSRYFGFGTKSIVAIGVATNPAAATRMIGIAAGLNYETLNNTQCSIDFQSALFNVTVDLVHRNLTVTPIDEAVNTTDIEPSGLLSFLATWQLTLISTDQTSLYTSLVGNSINASVNNFITLTNGSATDPAFTAEATLRGLANSVTAMIDDILTLYASAQIMVANSTQTVSTTVGYQAQKLGQRAYIIAVTTINSVLVLLVLLEAYRTRGWKGLVDFDYMDPRTLIIASSRGGEGIAAAADDRGASDNTAEKPAKAVSHKIGRLRIVQVGDKLMSANSANQLKVDDYPASLEAAAGPDEGREEPKPDGGKDGLTLDEGTELLSLNHEGEGLSLDEGREDLTPDEESGLIPNEERALIPDEESSLIPDVGKQSQIPNEETRMTSDEATESLLHRVVT